jgi:exo-beta-1,3-glucanase (GH17 family)
MANVHPWFGNVSIDTAADWTYQFFEQTDVAPTTSLTNHPTMYIAETGWPSVKPFGFISPIWWPNDDLDRIRLMPET